MVQLPNRMPTHHSDEDPRCVFGMGLEIGLDSHQVIGHSARNKLLACWRETLDRRTILVSWPQCHPTIIGRTQVLRSCAQTIDAVNRAQYIGHWKTSQ